MIGVRIGVAARPKAIGAPCQSGKELADVEVAGTKESRK